MTKKEIFIAVCDHLAKQKARSFVNGDYCVYRGPNGKKCAIGALIPDAMYQRKMEGKTISKLIDLAQSGAIELPEYFGHETFLLQSLQGLHDDHCRIGPEAMKEELQNISKIFRITDVGDVIERTCEAWATAAK